MGLGTFQWYKNGLLSLLNGEFPLLGDDLTVLLTTSGYNPDIINDKFIGDIDNQLVAAGYNEWGQSLVTSLVQDDVNGVLRLSTYDVSWINIVASDVACAVVYKMNMETFSDSRLIGYCQFPVPLEVNTGTLTLDFDEISGFLGIRYLL
jgi:hypothetical protein